MRVNQLPTKTNLPKFCVGSDGLTCKWDSFERSFRVLSALLNVFFESHTTAMRHTQGILLCVCVPALTVSLLGNL